MCKNKKKDGTNYNIYTDGLKIYTTINSRMQQYAEDAVKEHLGDYLQPVFFKEKEGSKNAPYARSLPEKRVEELLTKAMKQTDRYRLMKEAGASEQQIRKAFDTPEEMTVFSWKGDKDTIMTPMDSIRYYKFFLRAGFMSMDPRNGHVKAYVADRTTILPVRYGHGGTPPGRFYHQAFPLYTGYGERFFSLRSKCATWNTR